MKKVLTNFLAISSVALLMLSSCKKNDTLVTANLSKAGALTASTTAPAIEQGRIKDTTDIISFGFTASQYDAQIPEANTLQIDVDGDDWKSPASFALLNKATSQGFNTAEFDGLLLKIAQPGVSTKVNIRVQHALSGATSTYSNVISLTVTPINLTAWLYIVGAFQGWSTSSADSLVSVTGNGIYTGVINFPHQTGGSNHFLILPARNFDNKYATAGGPDTAAATTTSNYTSEYVSSGGNDFIIKNQGGVCLVTLNTNTNSLTVAPVDYYSLIGNAIPGSNWSVDTPLKFINDGSNTWSVTGLAMTKETPPNDGFKVRQNDDWGNSWGTSSTDGQLINDKTAVNIGVAADGNYNFSIIEAPTPFGTNKTNPLLVPYTFTKQ